MKEDLNPLTKCPNAGRAKSNVWDCELMSALSFMIVLSPSTSSPPSEGEQQAVLLTVAGMTIGDVSNWRHFLNSYLKWLSWMSLSLKGNSQENYRGCFFCCCCCCLFYLFYGFLIVRNISLRWNYSYICETYFFTIFIKLVFAAIVVIVKTYGFRSRDFTSQVWNTDSQVKIVRGKRTKLLLMTNPRPRYREVLHIAKI